MSKKISLSKIKANSNPVNPVNTRVAKEKKESLARKRPPKPTHPAASKSQREDKMDGYPKLVYCCGSCNEAVTNVVKNCREDEEEEDVHSTVSKLLEIGSENRQNLQQQQQYTHESINPSELCLT
jgi:hypothetical protein